MRPTSVLAFAPAHLPRPPRDLHLPCPPLFPANLFNHLAESVKVRVSTGTIFRDALLRSLANDIEN